MKPSAVRVILGLALCATLLAAYFAPPQASEAVVLTERASASRVTDGKGAVPVSPSRREPVAQATEVLSIKARDVDQPDDDATSVFASHPDAVPAAKVVRPETVPAPEPPPVAVQAPPLPFRVLGRFAEGEDAGVFLQLNDQNLVVRVGDTIAEHYKVESLTGNTLTLRYGPLNQLQTLDLGGSN